MAGMPSKDCAFVAEKVAGRCFQDKRDGAGVLAERACPAACDACDNIEPPADVESPAADGAPPADDAFCYLLRIDGVSRYAGQYLAAGTCGDAPFYDCAACDAAGAKLWRASRNWLVGDDAAFDGCAGTSGAYARSSPSASVPLDHWFGSLELACLDGDAAPPQPPRPAPTPRPPATPPPTPAPTPRPVAASESAADVACADSQSWHIASNPLKGCGFVADNVENRCFNPNKVDVDGVPSEVGCPVSCGTCSALGAGATRPPLPRPTREPTATPRPTPAPAPKPTKRPHPRPTRDQTPRPTPPRPTPPRPTPPRPTRAPSVRAAAPLPPPPGGFVVTLPGIAAIIGLCFVVAFGASAVAFRYFGGRGKEPAQQYELVSRDDYVDFDNGPRDSFNPFGR